MTIHKAQGQTLPKVVVDLGEKEYVAGCTFVALSRVRSINDLVLESMTFSRLQKISKCKNLQLRLAEEEKLKVIAQKTMVQFQSENDTDT